MDEESISRERRYAGNIRGRRMEQRGWPRHSDRSKLLKYSWPKKEAQIRKSRTQRIKIAMQKSKEMAKVLLEGITLNGGVCTAFRKAGAGMAEALRCAKEHGSLLEKCMAMGAHD